MLISLSNVRWKIEKKLSFAAGQEARGAKSEVKFQT
jgi:hypothetical protein